MSSVAEAAAVLLAAGPGSPQILAVKRSERLRFFGGYLAFPGGKVSPADAGEPAPGLAHAETGGAMRVRRAAAVRELFEETGVLLARRPDGSFPPSGPALDHFRRELIAERLSLAEALRQLHLTVREEDLVPVGEITTPAFVPHRFATMFFLAHRPPGQAVEVWPGELDEAVWTTADALLGRWERGELLISPPTVMTLEAVRGRAVDEAPARLGRLLAELAAGAVHPIYFAPAVRMIPLKTQSLPPSAYTNAYLVGTGPAYLIDPGPADPAEQQRLFAVLDAARTHGPPLTAVVLTHHHPDHVGAAAACARRYRVPVWAHAETARALGQSLPVERTLGEGDRLPLGTAPDGSLWALEALHTPGHAPGHLVFYEAHYRLLFTGDVVSTASSVVIAPPEGDLTVYLQSLRRLRSIPCRLLFPAHGNASNRAEEVIDQSLAHRAMREEMLLDALARGPRTVEDLALELYKGVPAEVVRFARLQTLAGLQKLQREGLAEPAADGWRTTERR